MLHPLGLAALLIRLSPCAGLLAPMFISPPVVLPFGPQHKYSPPYLLSQYYTLNLYAFLFRLSTPSLFPYQPPAPLVLNLRLTHNYFILVLSTSKPCYYYRAIALPNI